MLVTKFYNNIGNEKLVQTIRFKINVKPHHLKEIQGWVFTYSKSRCKISALFLNQCNSYLFSGKFIWELPSRFICRIFNILSYLKWNVCKTFRTQYILFY